MELRKILFFLPMLILLTFTGCDTPEIISFKISGDVQVETGSKAKLTAEITYEEGATQDPSTEQIIWASSDTSVAKVNKKGKVKTLAPGRVVITGTIPEVKGFCGIGGREEKVAAHIMMAINSDIPDGMVRVHYKTTRTTDFDGWGVYLWGDATGGEVLPWNDGPIPFDGTDNFGAYKDITIKEASGKFNIIIRWPEGQSSNITNVDPKYKEYWIQDGLDTAYAVLPPATMVITSEMISKTTIKANVFGDTTVLKDDLKILDQQGKEIEIKEVSANGSDVTITTEEISLDSNYTTSLYYFTTYVMPSRELLATDDYIYEGDDLGAILDGSDATFKVWSPTATAIKLHLYDKNDQSTEIGSGFTLTRGDKAIWEVSVDAEDAGVESLEGYYYQYEVTAFGETRRALDPYAKSMAPFMGDYVAENPDPIGKGAIIKMDSSEAGNISKINNSDIMANNIDLIVYEVHVRDFTSGAADVSDEKKAKFLGFIEKIPHLKKLGITHVQLLPVHNHYRVNENISAVDATIDGVDGQGKEFSVPNYNWGYDPHSYFSLEGQYSSDVADPYSRITEFRQLVKALHEAGIGVICDTVYNHTMNLAVFENIAPGCYHRPKGGTTPVSDPAVESRTPMVRKLIVDSLKNMVNNYGVNGFRFDLMGFMDNETMIQIREELGEDVVLQGEAWNYTDLPAEEAPIKGLYDSYPHGLNLAAFNDTSRDAYAGRMQAPGFLQGAYNDTAKAKAGIIAGLIDFDNGGEYTSLIDDDAYNRFTDNPEETLQFLTVHDGFTLWDKINLSYDGTAEERATIVKQASSMLFTSQGKVLIHAGSEMGRSKPLGLYDVETSRAHTTDLWNDDEITNLLYNADFTEEDPGYVKTENVSYFHENSYRSSDYTNKLRWENLDNPLYGNIFSYYQGLIKMRRSIPALRYAKAENIQKGLRFIGDVNPETVKSAGYTSFSEVETYTVKFIHAPSYAYNKIYYFAGEMHESGNPAEGNTYSVTFNNAGVGYKTFTKEEIDSIDYSRWGNAGVLDFKLVSAMGSWESFHNDNNRIDPAAILDGNTITINLSIAGHAPEAPSGDKDFVINYSNGPAGSTCYLVGEVHSGDANPASGNPYSVTFDANGNASITFTPAQVAAFDMAKWGDENFLSVKLVYTEGSWDSPEGAYQYDNNKIDKLYFNQDIGANIDLSVTDHVISRNTYSSFADLSELTIKFINADPSVAGTEVYLNGEVQPEEKLDNPLNNDFKFTFDANGNGSLTITKDQIDGFTLTRWGAPDDLNFKIVTAAGDETWPTIPGTYSGMGNNRLRVADVLQGGTVVVNLGLMDFDTNPSVVSSDVKFIAYSLDNSLETEGSATVYKDLIVIHNADSSPLLIETSKIADASQWVVIQDNNSAGIDPIAETDIAIDNGMVVVPAHTSAVIAK